VSMPTTAPHGNELAGIAGMSEEDRVAWRNLAAHRAESAPFVDEEWVSASIETFRPAAPLLLPQRQDGRLVGLAALWRQMCDSRRWDVIRVDHVPEGSPTLAAGLRVAREAGWRSLVEPTFESPWRPLSPLPASWDEGLTRKFKSNFRNRERRLQELGAVSFEVATERVDQARALEIFYALEASGWKGDGGTAIACRSHVKAFYDRLVERASPQIWIPVLSVGGRPAAAQLYRVQGRTMFMHKTAYDPEFSPFAPGQVLTARVIRHGIEKGMDALDFLADNMPWKADWAPQLRRHHRLLLFSPSAHGRYAYWTRYGVKEQARKIPGARRLVRWVQARAECA
jgi:CelD/BcsL family acetyltransferase involved in cellulose biosynthesis